MAIHVVQSLPTPEELEELYPIGPEHDVDVHRQEIKNILAGVDKRLLMVTGPCSAWPSDAVREYSDRLARLGEDIKDRVYLVLRAYIQKPRTVAGWPGPLQQPDPLGPIDIRKGIVECRKLMSDVAKQHPLADEMLVTHNADHFDGLISYTAVGARSSEDTEHRHIASGLDSAVGVKNPTSGDIVIGVNGVQVAQMPQQFIHHNQWVRTDGNSYSHLILRGGSKGSNYDPHSIAQAHKELTNPKRGIKNPAIIVDASHDNSKNGHGKDHTLQSLVAASVMHGIKDRRAEYEYVRGLMLESFMKAGKQDIGPNMDLGGLSITDGCLSWEQTESLLRGIADDVDRIQ